MILDIKIKSVFKFQYEATNINKIEFKQVTLLLFKFQYGATNIILTPVLVLDEF